MAVDIEKRIEALRARYNRKEETDKYKSTGSVVFDLILSEGRGLPEKRIVQISGDSGVGKSTAALHFCKAACARGERCFYLDSEFATNKSQYIGIGLQPYIENGLFNPMDVSTYEQAEEVLDTILGDPSTDYHGDTKCGIIVIDSFTTLIPAKLLQESVEKVLPGAEAQVASKFLKKYTAAMMQTDCPATVIFVNQMRTNISFIHTTTQEAGGNAQKFLTDIRMQMRCVKKLEKQMETMNGKTKVPYGAECELWSEKNRHAAPFIKVPVTVIFGKGISNMAAYQRFMERAGICKQGNAGYYTITLPSGEIKARGLADLHKKIHENIEEIKPLLDESGVMKLIIGESEDE